ncbi:DEAD/DEAH box helicase [Polymorphospora lycopeni]|uniref:SNF2-related protein n=1 Tax=Polymorphospora lycopeni TaxID=3140240 RepID=A0ABV5D2D1_9ACTN
MWRRCAVVFEPADPPRAGRLAFWSPDGGPPPDDVPGDGGELTVAVPDGAGVTVSTVAARRLPVGTALPLLAEAGAQADAHPAAAFWSAAADVALHLVARGRLLPGVSPAGFDAWRVGPLDADDVGRIGALGAAMPGWARAVPVPAAGGVRLPAAYPLLRAFLDAVADDLPRDRDADGTAYAGRAPRRVDGLRDWAAELAAGVDAGVRVSLRLEVPGGDPAAGPWQAVVQVHGLADPGLVADVAPVWAGAAAGLDARAPQDVVLAVRRAARVWEPLRRLLSGPVPDRMVLGDDEVAELVDGAARRLAAAGVAVHWPREVERDVSVRALVGAGSGGSGAAGGRVFGAGALLSFDWQVALRGEPLTAAELEVLAAARRPVVRLRDRWVLVAPEVVARAREGSLPAVAAVDGLAAVLSGSTVVGGEPVEVVADGWLARLRERLATPDSATPDGAGPDAGVAVPAGLTATLRDYQVRGLRWLVRMTSLGLGACLADDMGLGKTVTLIALHLHRQADPATAGPTLVVCPATLLGNWEREVRRFAPGIEVSRFHGPDRSLDAVTGGFVLTTYATMRLDAARLARFGWALVVADEAQHVKNAGSLSARALRLVAGGAGARVALTGTPVENNLDELWAILDWATPGLLGPRTVFRRRWADPVESGDEAAARGLARLVGPFLLRRRKSDPDVVPELPAKTQTDRPVALSVEQVALYEAVVREALARLPDTAGMARRGAVVSLLTALKQICNHPAQYLKEDEPVLAGRSGKLELLDELVDAIVAGGGAVLVFTQYVAMGRLLRRHLRGRGFGGELLHGGTSLPRRQELVDRFQAGAVPVFVLSLKAAGTGLNLTRADHVVHFDRWWNPAVEDQATDRAYRIGQTRPVQVHRLVAEGTVEDRIAAMLSAKRELADAVLHSGAAALTELSDAELAELVVLR